MRFRTRLVRMTAATAVGVLVGTAPAAGNATAGEPALPGGPAAVAATGGPVALSAVGGPAGRTAPKSPVLPERNVCAPAKPPYATCFARIRGGVGPLNAAAVPSGYGPADLRSAYRLPATGGADQVIGLVVAHSNPNLEADLTVYREHYGLPPCTSASGCLRIVNQRGEASPLPAPDEGWGIEMSVDVDMASAICPACRLLVVQADSSALSDLGAAVDTAVRLGANAVGNSYGTGVEFANQQTYEVHYNHPGHAIVAAAGDTGYSVSYPAASAYVTAVGGTTLTRDESGAWSETVWSGTGSGCSAYIAKPAWQTDPYCPTRTVNDVSAVGDLDTGVAIYDTFGGNGWAVAGGTSVGTPIIAAAYALTGANDRVRHGSTPWLRSGDGGAFRDVTSGTNVPGPGGSTCGGDYLCTGVPGYDAPTGWGTPQGLSGLTP